MFFKSIRWRLQMWYGLILLAVLAGFGVTAFELQRGRQFRRVDEELLRRVGELANALRMAGPPNRGRNFLPPPGVRPPPHPDDDDDASRRPPPDVPPDSSPRPGFDRPPSDFNLPP